MKNEILLTEEKIINTFSIREQNRYKKFKLALELKSKEYKNKKITEMLEMNYGVICFWLNGTYEPRSVKQIKRLRILGLLPFNLNLNENDKKVQLILKIGFFTLGDGHISKRNEVILTGFPKDLDDIENECKEFGIFCWRYNDKRYLYIGDNIARILVALGFPKNRKTTQEFLLPSWLFDSSLYIKNYF